MRRPVERTRVFDATFYTVADSGFFPGVVALLNSLRLTGNDAPLVVVDAGLTASERSRLTKHTRLVPLPEDSPLGPHAAKPYAARLQDTGVAVLIDSDMIVTKRLDPYVALAQEGPICLFPDHRSARGRQCAEWSEVLGLRAPLRRRMYMNSGFVCLSVDHQRDFLARWSELSALIPVDQGFTTPAAPFYALDQDVLNALIASEVAHDAVVELPADEEVYWDELRDVEILDRDTLESRFRGGAPAILHYSFRPKPWERAAWVRVVDDAYVRLLPRVLFADDVALRLDPAEFPTWVRPGRGARAVVRALDAGHRSVKAAIAATPAPLRIRLLGLRNGVVRAVSR